MPAPASVPPPSTSQGGPSTAPTTQAENGPSHDSLTSDGDLHTMAQRSVQASRALQASIAQGRRLPTAEEQTRLFRELQRIQSAVGHDETLVSLPTQSAVFSGSSGGAGGPPRKSASEAAQLRRALLLHTGRDSVASDVEHMHTLELDTPLHRPGAAVGGGASQSGGGADNGTYRSGGGHSSQFEASSGSATPSNRPKTPPSSSLKQRSLNIAGGAVYTPEGIRGGGNPLQHPPLGSTTAPPTPAPASAPLPDSPGGASSAQGGVGTAATTVVLGGAGSLPTSPADTASVASSHFTSVSHTSGLSKAAKRRQRRKKLQSAKSGESSAATSPLPGTPPDPLSGGNGSTRPSSPARLAAEEAAATGAAGVPPSKRASGRGASLGRGGGHELTYERLGQLDREELLTSARLLLAERCSWRVLDELHNHSLNMLGAAVHSGCSLLQSSFPQALPGEDGVSPVVSLRDLQAAHSTKTHEGVGAEALEQLQQNLGANQLGVQRSVAEQVWKLQAAVAAAVDSAADAGMAAAQLCGDMSSEAHDLKSHVAELEESLADALQQKDQLRGALQGAASDTQGVAEQVAAMQAELVAAQDDAQHWRREADKAQSRIDMLSDQLTKVTTRLNAANAKAGDAQLLEQLKTAKAAAASNAAAAEQLRGELLEATRSHASDTAQWETACQQLAHTVLSPLVGNSCVAPDDLAVHEAPKRSLQGLPEVFGSAPGSPPSHPMNALVRAALQTRMRYGLQKLHAAAAARVHTKVCTGALRGAFMHWQAAARAAARAKAANATAAELRSTVAQLRNALEAAGGELSDLGPENDALRGEVAALKVQCEQLRSELQQQHELQGDMDASATEQLEALNSQLGSTSRRADAAAWQVAAHKADLADMGRSQVTLKLQAMLTAAEQDSATGLLQRLCFEKWRATAEYEKAVERTTSISEEFQDEIRQLQQEQAEELSSLQATLLETTARMDDLAQRLEKQAAASEHTIVALHKRLANANDAAALQSAQSRTHEQQCAVQDLQQTIGNAEATKTALSDQLSAAREEVQAERAALATSKAVIGTLQEQVAAARAAAEANSVQLRAELYVCEEKVASLQGDLLRAKAASELPAAALLEAKSELEATLAQLRTKQVAFEEAQDEMSTAHANIAALNTAHAATQQLLERTKEHGRAAQAAAASREDELQARLQGVQLQLGDSEAREDAAQVQLVTTQGKLRSAEGETAASAARVDALKTALSELQAEIQRQAEVHESTLAAQQEQMASAQEAAAAEAAVAAAAHKDEVADSEARAADLQDALCDVQQQLVSAQDCSAAAEADLSAAQDAAATARQAALDSETHHVQQQQLLENALSDAESIAHRIRGEAADAAASTRRLRQALALHRIQLTQREGIATQTRAGTLLQVWAMRTQLANSAACNTKVQEQVATVSQALQLAESQVQVQQADMAAAVARRAAHARSTAVRNLMRLTHRAQTDTIDIVRGSVFRAWAAKTQVAALSAALGTAQAAVETHQSDASQAKAAAHEMRSEAMRLAAALKDEQAQCVRAKQGQDAALQGMQRRAAALDALRTRLDESADDLLSIRSSLAQARRAEAVAVGDAEAAATRVARLQAALAAAQTNHEEHLQASDELVGNLRAQVDDALEAGDALAAKLAAVEERVWAAGTENTALLAEKARLQAAANSARSAMQSRNAELEAATAAANTLQAEIAQLQSQNTSLQNNAEAAVSSAQASDAKAATLQHQLLLSQERVADLSSASSAAQSTISALEDKLHALNEHKTSMLERVASIESQLVEAAERASNKHTTDRNKLKATVAQLAGQTEQLTAALSKAHAELRDERSRVCESRDAGHAAVTSVHEARAELEEQRARFEGLLAQAAAAQAAATDDAQAARRRAAEALARSKDSNRSIARLKADLANTQERLEVAQGGARELQATRKLLVQTNSRLKRSQARAAAAASAVAAADSTAAVPPTEHKLVQTDPPAVDVSVEGGVAAEGSPPLSPRSMHKMLSRRSHGKDPDASMDRIGQLVFAYNALKDRHNDLQLELQLVSHKVKQAESARASEHAARRTAEVQRDALEHRLRTVSSENMGADLHYAQYAARATQGANALSGSPAPARTPPVLTLSALRSTRNSSGASLLADSSGALGRRAASPGPYLVGGGSVQHIHPHTGRQPPSDAVGGPRRW